MADERFVNPHADNPEAAATYRAGYLEGAFGTHSQRPPDPDDQQFIDHRLPLRPSGQPDLRRRRFSGNTILQAIAEDLLNTDGTHIRISTVELSDDPAVLKIQTALLDWRPDCLPQWGADGSYGEEAARAVHSFKIEELGGPAIRRGAPA